MNASEFFRDIVRPNYEEFINSPDDLRLLWNAVVSMNTVPEFVALHQRGYSQVDRNALASEADRLREQSLRDLKHCAETYKHVRKITASRNQTPPFTTVATSTGGVSGDPTTWRIGHYDPVDVLRRAFSTLAAFPELK